MLGWPTQATEEADTDKTWRRLALTRCTGEREMGEEMGEELPGGRGHGSRNRRRPRTRPEVGGDDKDNKGLDDFGEGRASGVGELLDDEKLGSPVLEQEERQRAPDYALKDDDLDHEIARVGTSHSLDQRNAHDEGVWMGGKGEECYGPLQAASGAGSGPDSRDDEDNDLLEGVSGDEAVVHAVRVDGGKEVE